MEDNDKTPDELLAEIAALRRQLRPTPADGLSPASQPANIGETTPQIFRSIFSRSPLGIAVASAPDLRILLVNQQLCDFLGYTEDELLSLSVPDITGDDLPAEVSGVANLEHGEQKTCSRIKQYRCKDGTLRWGKLTAASLTRQDDGSFLVVGMVEDIAGQKHAEEALQRIESSLGQAERLATLGLLAAGVAHEVNNPLTYMLHGLTSLQEQLLILTEQVKRLEEQLTARIGEDAAQDVLSASLKNLLPESLLKWTGQALEGAHRIRDIVRHLKAFSRADEERLEPLSLNHVIENVLKLARKEIGYRAKLVKHFSDLPTIIGNEARLTQVFLNLVLNAIQAMEDGAIDANQLAVRTWREEGMVGAEIADTGAGIAPEHLARIFDPFFTTKAVGEGSGLGLTITQTIVHAHGGRIAVESERGVGTRIRVYLPLHLANKVADAPAIAQPAAATVASVSGRVLVIDDEPHICELLRRTLSEQCEVVVAYSGSEARAILEHDQRFAAIVCDLMMPGISGMDIYQWLAQAHPTLTPHMLFITGGAFTERARMFLRETQIHCLEKPFDDEEILTALGKVLTP